MKIKIIAEGGNMQPGPVIAQQLGPLGINMGKVITDVNSATSGFKGMKVPVELDVDTKNKEFSIEVFSPPVAELIKKELGIEKGSGEAKKIKAGNIAFENLVKIAKTKQDDLLARDLKAGVRMIVGSCVSLGVLIDNKEAVEIEREIDEGKYDREIKEEVTQVSEEKKKELEEFFGIIKDKQEKDMKALEKAKEAEEASKKAEESKEVKEEGKEAKVEEKKEGAEEKK